MISNGLRKERRLQLIHRQRNVVIAILAGVLLFGGNGRAAVTLPDAASGIAVQVETNGEYEVRSREPARLFGGTVGYPIQKIKTGSGRDAIGAYVSNADNNGLGPRFNSISCCSCHAQPTVGGSCSRTIRKLPSSAAGRSAQYDSVLHHGERPNP